MANERGVQEKKSESAKDLAVKALRQAILSGSLSGGHRLNQGELADTLGVSRMPVREALRQLEVEGLVVNYPHKGFEVSRLSLTEIIDIFDIRAELELMTTESAIPNLTDEVCDRMETLLSEMDRLADNPVRWLKLNSEFHDLLYACSQRAYLNKLINNLRGNSERYLRLFLTVPTYHESAQREHRTIVAECRRRDPAAAGQRVREHLISTRDALVAFLKETRPEENPFGQFKTS